MTVCNIQAGDLCKKPGKIRDHIVIGHSPQGMSHPVSCGEVVLGRIVPQIALQKNLDFFIFPVGQEHRLRMGVAHIKMSDPILFLFYTGVFVFPDHIVQIVIHRYTADQTDLNIPVHHLFVDVEHGFGLFQEDPLVQKVFKIGRAHV